MLDMVTGKVSVKVSIGSNLGPFRSGPGTALKSEGPWTPAVLASLASVKGRVTVRDRVPIRHLGYSCILILGGGWSLGGAY